MQPAEVVRRYIEEFLRESGLAAGTRVDVFAFGDSPAMNDDLGRLVFHGPKRATASLLAAHLARGEPMPVENGYSVVLDGRGLPLGVIRTTAVRVLPFADVDAAFAFDEGEGDRSLAGWRDAHRDYFMRECSTLGLTFAADAAQIICERFEVVARKGD